MGRFSFSTAFCCVSSISRSCSFSVCTLLFRLSTNPRFPAFPYEYLHLTSSPPSLCHHLISIPNPLARCTHSTRQPHPQHPCAYICRHVLSDTDSLGYRCPLAVRRRRDSIS
ncbi:hypothetical protein DENSPDRAFT_844641, partial [Dentipellis sp. KUC8613]